MALLYANENYPFAVVEELRRLGHDVLTTQDTGKSGLAIPDDQVLQAAISMHRTVLTHNRRDFIRLHNCIPSHDGIVVCSVDKDFAALARRIHEKLIAIGDLKGQLIRISRPQS
ncbi:MAG TPA: DUF5615 family PIN-like protein [Pirellulales bacterium]|nr:DUF5615 family PIN-like protein [Pirellulales bacterium]